MYFCLLMNKDFIVIIIIIIIIIIIKYNAYILLIATLMKPLINFGRTSIDRGVRATTIQKLNANDTGAACRTKPF